MCINVCDREFVCMSTYVRVGQVCVRECVWAFVYTHECRVGGRPETFVFEELG